MSDADDKREQINYISVDSAPKRFAGSDPWASGLCGFASGQVLAGVQVGHVDVKKRRASLALPPD